MSDQPQPDTPEPTPQIEVGETLDLIPPAIDYQANLITRKVRISFDRTTRGFELSPKDAVFFAMSIARKAAEIAKENAEVRAALKKIKNELN